MSLLKPGQVFAQRYVIRRKLAEGGMGAVFVAVQASTELEVAVKVLWPHVLEQETAVKRFSLEARVSARIGSSHVVKVFDAGFDEETQMPFLVMELLQGSTLQDLVAKNGPCSFEETVEYLHQASLALDKAHNYVDKDGQPAPVIHRDLKPENIFLTRLDSGAPFIKVLDYGLAKILGSSTGLSRDLKGTPLYMASEQALGKALSPATDIWPLGLIALYLLTGRQYWNAASKPESGINHLISEIVALPMPAVSERFREQGVSHKLPQAFDRWFDRCVHREPERRFQSAGAAVSALRRVLIDGLPIESSGEFDRTIAVASLSPPTGVQTSSDGIIGAPAVHSGGERRVASSDLESTFEPANVDELPGIPVSRRPSMLVWGGAVALFLGATSLAFLDLSPKGVERDANSAKNPADAADPGGPTLRDEQRRVQVISYPRGAEVLVNGEFLCRAPCSIGAPDGSFELRLQLSGHEPLTRSVVAPYPPTIELPMEPVVAKEPLHSPSPGPVRPRPSPPVAATLPSEPRPSGTSAPPLLPQ